MPSRDAQRLAEHTGCMLHEAVSILDAIPEWDEAVSTLEAVMNSRRRLYDQNLLAVWGQFAASEQSDALDVTQTIDFLTAIGVNLESPLVLCIAYELQAPAIGTILRQPFVDGWARLEAASLAEMKQCVSLLNVEFQKYKYFREVYHHTFELNLEKDAKSIPKDIAMAYWEVLLLPRYTNIIKYWFEFLNEEQISRDTWNMLLEFCEYQMQSDPTLAQYDESSSWPVVIDDFVEFLRKSSFLLS